jgi:hypothetical protein
MVIHEDLSALLKKYTQFIFIVCTLCIASGYKLAFAQSSKEDTLQEIYTYIMFTYRVGKKIEDP